MFGFPEWDYTFLDEVLLYPGHFDRDYDIGSKSEAILGMVGSGNLQGKMILSKPALPRLEARLRSPEHVMSPRLHREAAMATLQRAHTPA